MTVLTIGLLRRLCLLAALAGLSGPALAADQPKPADQVLARVNGVAITQRLLDAYQQLNDRGLLLPGATRDLASLADVLLLAQEAQRRGIDHEPTIRPRLRNLAVDDAWDALDLAVKQAALPQGLAEYAKLAADPAYQLVRLRMLVANTQAEAQSDAAAIAAGAAFETLAAAHPASPCALLSDTPQLGTNFPCRDKAGDLGYGRFLPQVDAGPFPGVGDWPAAIEPVVAHLVVGGVTAPVELDGRWVLLRVEDRRPITPGEALPALFKSVADSLVRPVVARVHAVPFVPVARIGDDLVVGHIGDEPITAYDIAFEDDRNYHMTFWRILDPLEARLWAYPQVADSSAAHSLMDAFGMLTEARSNPWLAKPADPDGLALWRAAVLADALGWRLVNDALADGQLDGIDVTEVLTRFWATDTAEHAAALVAGVKAGRDPTSLGIPVQVCDDVDTRCLPDGLTVFYVMRPATAESDQFLRVLATLPIGVISDAIPYTPPPPSPPPLPSVDLPDDLSDKTPPMHHGFDVGVVLARLERRLLRQDSTEFDIGARLDGALLQRLRAAAVIETTPAP
jgi:hypothetical protein